MVDAWHGELQQPNERELAFMLIQPNGHALRCAVDPLAGLLKGASLTCPPVRVPRGPMLAMLYSDAGRQFFAVRVRSVDALVLLTASGARHWIEGTELLTIRQAAPGESHGAKLANLAPGDAVIAVALQQRTASADV